jgi:hypothetical protein
MKGISTQDLDASKKGYNIELPMPGNWARAFGHDIPQAVWLLGRRIVQSNGLSKAATALSR